MNKYLVAVALLSVGTMSYSCQESPRKELTRSQNQELSNSIASRCIEFYDSPCGSGRVQTVYNSTVYAPVVALTKIVSSMPTKSLSN